MRERAATVTELAAAVGRPKSTVAHHVKVLTEGELVRAVRTRRVRAMLPADFDDFEVAARESAAAFRDRRLWGIIRHARLSEPADGHDQEPSRPGDSNP